MLYSLEKYINLMFVGKVLAVAGSCGGLDKGVTGAGHGSNVQFASVLFTEAECQTSDTNNNGSGKQKISGVKKENRNGL